MEFLMDNLRAIASIRNPVLDFFFEVYTYLGDEITFLIVSMVFFWCINKRTGYFVLISGLFGIVVNQFMKITFRIPRPWAYDPNFPIVESAREAASGYSFPSGHTQCAAGTFGVIAATRPTRVKGIVCTVIILLVAFSRMYLGVHTLLDVVVSLFIALGIILLMRPVFADEDRFLRFMPAVCIVSVALSLGLLVYMLILSGDSTLDPVNHAGGLKNACTMFGCTLGLAPVYYIDKKFTKFDTRAPWYIQIVKVAVGFGCVILIKSGLSSPLIALFGNEYVARVVRYLLIVLVAGVLWPMFFRRLSAIRCAPLDRFGEKLRALFSRRKSVKDE